MNDEAFEAEELELLADVWLRMAETDPDDAEIVRAARATELEALRKTRAAVARAQPLSPDEADFVLEVESWLATMAESRPLARPVEGLAPTLDVSAPMLDGLRFDRHVEAEADIDPETLDADISVRLRGPALAGQWDVKLDLPGAGWSRLVALSGEGLATLFGVPLGRVRGSLIRVTIRRRRL